MVSDAEEKDIEKLMRRIKDAKNEEMGQEEIHRRTMDLMNYLSKRGLWGMDV